MKYIKLLQKINDITCKTGKVVNIDDNLRNKIMEFDKKIFNIIYKLKTLNDDCKYHIFGSKPFDYINNRLIDVESDCDIVCNQMFFDKFLKKLNNYKLKKLDISELNNESSLQQETFRSLLVFSQIKYFFKLKLNIDGNLIYKIDLIVSDMQQLDTIVSKYSQNLISTKSITYDLNKELNFVPRFSDNLVKSIYQPDIYQSSIYSLIYILTLYLKLFDQNGIKREEFKLCPIEKIKKIIGKNKKLNKYKIFDKLKSLIYDKKLCWLTFNTNIYYKCLIFDELIRFPLSNDLEDSLKRMNLIPKINGYMDIYKRWYVLLKRVYSSNLIEGITDVNIMECNDEFVILKEIKKITNTLRMSFNKYSCDLNCPICLDRIEKTSPIHMCRNGHISHLTCIIEQERKLLVNILTQHNFDKDFETNNCHLCGICRDENILMGEELYKNENSDIIGSFRYKEFDINNNKPLDLFIHKDTNISTNIVHCDITCNFNDYIIEKYNYLQKII